MDGNRFVIQLIKRERWQRDQFTSLQRRYPTINFQTITIGAEGTHFFTHDYHHRLCQQHLPTSGTANRWRLMRGGREVRVSMEGQLLLNTIELILDAAIDGHGLAYLPFDPVQRAFKDKKRVRVLEKFPPALPGYHLYYPHCRHAGSAFSLFIDTLKYKGEG